MTTVSKEFIRQTIKLPDDIINKIITFIDYTIEIVINRRYGGFSLSSDVMKILNACGMNITSPYESIERDCPHLIYAVKNAANTDALKIVKVDNSKNWFITEYDGLERVNYAENIKRGTMFINGLMINN